jgi:hypothetical protein
MVSDSRNISHRRKKGAQTRFLGAFRSSGNVRLAAEAAGVDRSRHYHWLTEDPEYGDEFAAAKEDAIEALEAEVYRRGVQGVDEPVGWYRGQAGGTVKKYSDLLLLALLRAHAPERWRERVEVRGAMATIDYDRVLPLLSDEQLLRLKDGTDIRVLLAELASAGMDRLLPPGREVAQAGIAASNTTPVVGNAMP